MNQAAGSLFGGAVLAAMSALAQGQPVATEKVETTHAILSFKAGSGDLIGVQWKHPKLDVIGEPKLGENFRILLPRPDYEANYFNSREQVLRKIEKNSDGVVLHYGPLKNEWEEVNVNVDYEIRDTASQLQFSIHIENGTDRKLAEVFYGILGGQQGIVERVDTESLVPSTFHGNLASNLFRQFAPNSMPFATPFDFASYVYPGDMSMGWMDVYNAKAGIGYYYANQDPETRIALLYTEMHPYAKTLSPQDNWPSAAELPTGEPVGLTMGWVNFPYTAKGAFRAGPLALQVHEGDWHVAAKIYRGWFDQHFQVARAPSWLRKEMAWYSVNLLNPEDQIVYRFKDLPRLAAEAKRYGITTFQVFGWAKGGQDRGRPDYSPDPRLGTREELKTALAEMRAMGVHPLLYVNVQSADSSTEAFRTRWARYAVQGRWAPDWLEWGFGAGTIGGRTMRNVKRQQILMSPAHPAFREELLRQYLERIHDGAEGLQIDGAGINGVLDFNPGLATSPDRSLPQGMLEMEDDFLSRARKLNPAVALSLQDSFDRAFPYNDVAYAGMDAKDSAMAVRYTFPEWTFVNMVERPGDFGLINNGLLYGLPWGMAPRYHTAALSEALTQPLSCYVSELIRIRKQYPDLLFLGRFNDTAGAKVDGDAQDIRYSVFTPMDVTRPERACVVVNFGDRAEPVTVSLDDKQGQKATISTPFEADRVAVLPAKLMIPPHRAAVLVTR
jgi:hypothetical protein